MVLTKSLSEDFGAVPETRKYLVLPGDNLHRIVRKFDLPEGLSPGFIKSFRKANPQVRNLDRLVAGQVLLIPVGAGAPSEAAAGAGEENASSVPSLPIVEPSDVTAPGPLLSEVFTRLGEKIQSQGTLYFPKRQGSGSFSLDGGRYPLVHLTGGSVLVLDLEGTIPAPTAELIESAWPGYRVVRLSRDSTPEQALDAVLNAGSYYSVARRKNLVLGGETQLSISCDWLVEKTPESILNGSLYAVNYARHPREVIPPVIREYAARYNIEVVNLPAGSDQKAAPPAADPAPAERIVGSDRAALVDGLLRRLGAEFRENGEVSLENGSAPGLGIAFIADRLVETPQGPLAISFGDIPVAMAALLRGKGIRSLALPAAAPPPEQTLAAVLSALGVRYFGPDLEFFQSGDGGSDKFVITIPGIFIRHRGESLLFTGKVPEEHLLAFLTDRGVRLIVY